MRARRDVLRRMRADGSRIIRLEEEASQARVDLSDAEGQLRDLEADLADAPEGTEEIITKLIDEHAQTNIALNNTRSRLKASRDELSRKEKAVAALSEKLRKLGAPGSGQEDRKVSLLMELHELLASAVNEFRDRLRDRVEDQASEVFRALSAESDYARLRINDSYGLTILHSDGTEVISRSSGYEHVVALSLIAALQRCSPMSGPIVSDSPFGRLDKTHKEHVLRALPQITDQVLLLVHHDELDRTVGLEPARHEPGRRTPSAPGLRSAYRDRGWSPAVTEGPTRTPSRINIAFTEDAAGGRATSVRSVSVRRPERRCSRRGRLCASRRAAANQTGRFRPDIRFELQCRVG